MRNKLQHLIIEENRTLLETYGWNTRIRNKLQAITECRTSTLGGRVAFCPDHHGMQFLFNSCKTRGCPVCMEFDQLKWVHKQRQRLLPQKHKHLVFKISGFLTRMWLLDKEQMQTIMFNSLNYAITRIGRQDKITRGTIAVLHTWGSDLSYHPHIHALITEGGLDKNREWQEIPLNLKQLGIYYSKKIKSELKKALNKKTLNRIAETEIKEHLEDIEAEEYKIYHAGTYEHGEGILKYVSKHLKSGAISHKNIITYYDENITFKYRENGKWQYCKLKKAEFLKRYINHIPLNEFRIVRNYGLYSPRKLKETLEYKKGLGIEIDESELEPEPMKCPVCQKEMVLSEEWNREQIEEALQILKGQYPEKPPPEYGSFFKTTKMNSGK